MYWSLAVMLFWSSIYSERLKTSDSWFVVDCSLYVEIC